MKIEGVDLIPERSNYKVDASGRIIIPAYMRAKYDINSGDYMEYYTAEVDGKMFLCCTKYLGNKKS